MSQKKKDYMLEASGKAAMLNSEEWIQITSLLSHMSQYYPGIEIKLGVHS